MEKNHSEETPKQILFAQLVPSINKYRSVRVKSVLSTKFRFHCNPGAKRIDVISRVMFPGTFAALNIVYWAYYLSMADTVIQQG